MNMVLLDHSDLVGANRARLTGRRADHIRTVLRAHAGDTLRVGLLGGGVGQGTVVAAGVAAVEFDFEITGPPPPASGVTLILALPRPKCLRRVLQCVATMGVKRLILFGANRVEKSYWASPWLEEDAVREQLILGLEQAGDTRLPVVVQHRLFKPFVEDVLPELARGAEGLLAYPDGGVNCPAGVAGPICLAIGPEGGWTGFETGLLQEKRFVPIGLGWRTLRSDTACIALLAVVGQAMQGSR
jgi:RsmE family RNA methyltransferase